MPAARMTGSYGLTEADIQAHQARIKGKGRATSEKPVARRKMPIKGGQISIKPLTANRLWAGRRIKSTYYKAFERDALRLLPSGVSVPDGDLIVEYEFGFSSPLADWDNPIKPFQDVLQKKYGFDDRRIVRAVVSKSLVKKGNEFIRFSIDAA